MEKKYIEIFFENIKKKKEYDVFSIALPINLIYKCDFNENEQLFKDKYNLIHSDIDVLAALYFNNKELSPTELYSAVVFSSGGMTKVLKKLESLGYISRNKNIKDKRSVFIKLERKGEEVLLNCLDDLVQLKSKKYELLTKNERETLKKILKKIVINLPN